MIAIVLLSMGVLIRLVAMLTLGRQFSFMLVPQAVINTDGIYRRVRHPSYVGTMLMLAGVALLSPVIAVMWMAYMFFLSRAVMEEQILSRNPDYVEYMKHTGRFVPKIGSELWQRRG